MPPIKVKMLDSGTTPGSGDGTPEPVTKARAKPRAKPLTRIQRE
jgi:hypothetical protein